MATAPTRSAPPPAAPPSVRDPQPGQQARSHPRLRGLADCTDRPDVLGMLSGGAPGSRVGSLCAAEPARAHGERAAPAAAAAAGPRRIRAGTRGESHSAPRSRPQRRLLPRSKATKGPPEPGVGGALKIRGGHLRVAARPSRAGSQSRRTWSRGSNALSGSSTAKCYRPTIG